MDTNPLGMIKFSAKTTRPKSRTKKSRPLPLFIEFQRQQICEQAARIIQEEGIRDYHKAKLRACAALHLKSNCFLPTNEEIENALQNRLHLFKTTGSETLKISQYRAASDMLTILSEFQPRLTGNLTNGIVLKDSPIEIHVFSTSDALVTDELNWRGVSHSLAKKRYRYSNNTFSNVPLITCRLNQVTIEISVFDEKQLHRLPVCPTNGKPYKRLSSKQLAWPHPGGLEE